LTSKYCCIIGVSFSPDMGGLFAPPGHGGHAENSDHAGQKTLVSAGVRALRACVINLHHTDLGGAGNPPLLLLHGLLGSSRNWQTAGRDLASRWHVLALDARNHGRSPHAPEMNYEVLADDVADWMRARGLASATLLGHSMGGKTAMLLACRQPAFVERLIVVDIAPKDYAWAAHRAEFAAMNELDLSNLSSRVEAELRFEGRVPSLGMRKFLTTNLERDDAGGWRWITNLPVLTEALPTLERNCLAPGDRYDGPTLFIAGGKSGYVQAADHALIRAHFPQAVIETIPEAGHNPHMETRAQFTEQVLGCA
jgi:pimeloyl-ACP methyl ester carboxylesterase